MTTDSWVARAIQKMRTYAGCATTRRVAVFQRVFVQPEPKCTGLPNGFRFTICGTTGPVLLITAGADVKIVQTKLRHTCAKTTLDAHAHLWTDSDDSTRAVVDSVLTSRADCLRTVKVGGINPQVRSLPSLDVVVELELVGGRAQLDWQHLVDTLPVDPSFDEVLGKDAALKQVLMVCLKCGQHFRQ